MRNDPKRLEELEEKVERLAKNQAVLAQAMRETRDVLKDVIKALQCLQPENPSNDNDNN